MTEESESELPFNIEAGRGLMSESEREALLGNKSRSYKSQTRQKIINRASMISDDLEFVAETDPDLYEKLKSHLNFPGGSYPASDLKDDIEELKEMQREILENQTDD